MNHGSRTISSIAVEDAARVAILDGGDKLVEVPTAKIFGESALGEPGEELAALEELHGEEDLGLGGEDLVELDDVGVREAVCEAKSWSPAEIAAYPYVQF
ncbi:hypothetical protein Syun_029824 [Stephania yunnanensis]|uniref:Uncharacterized protein n=1 Tax=Stephania yunnanensis TaxID=152371 RepID=A0AAP0E651_9MAGN